MSIHCLLWDFGDTLCDEKFIWSSGPEWEAIYRLLDHGWGEAWNTGEMSDCEFATLASQHISMPPCDILAHMHERCKHVDFYEFTYGFYLARKLPQAIVTVNPRLWSDVISPLYKFDQSSDAIVASWQEGTCDKAELCEIALVRLGLSARNSALLIDNKLKNVDAWRSRGGRGYHFTSDAQFRQDVARGIDALAV